ncbi:MAG: hypothetical protein AAF125_00280, partial [Chloroflexota bacterium]
MRNSRIFVVLLSLAGAVALLMTASLANPLAAQSDTDVAQQATVDAAVDAAFTQTAQALVADVEATTAFEATVASALQAALTATFQPPTATPLPTETPLPGGLLTSANINGLQQTTVYQPDGGTITAVATKGNLVATGADNGIVTLWEAYTGAVQRTFTHDAGVVSVAFNPAQPQVFVNDAEGTVHIWDTETGESIPVPAQTISGPAAFVGFADDGSIYADFTYEGEVTGFSTSPLTDVGASGLVEGLAWGLADFDAGLFAYTYTDTPNQIALVSGEPFNTNDALVVTFPDEVGYAEAVAFNADGSRLIALTDTATNYVIDTATGDTLFTYPAAGTGLSAFSPTGTLIADVNETGSLTVYNATDGGVFATLPGHTAAGVEAAFSSSGEFIVTTGRDNTARVWSLTAPQAPQVVAAEPTPVPEPAGPTPLPDGFPPVTNAEVQVAEQVFEGGRMFWVQPVNQLWVMIVNEDGRGQWLVYPDNFDEAVDDPTDPAIVAPEGLIQPERGFGKLWRENPEIRDALGWAVTPEFG